jgi:hypothetical protein
MAALVWDAVGERLYETGTDHGVLYPWDKTANSGAGGYGAGVAWNGLTGVSEAPSGAETTSLWADNIKYLNLLSTEEFSGTITAYMYPDEFAECDGSAFVQTGVAIGQQSRKTFGLAYRTILGNDSETNDYSEKIHLVYGCTASPSSKDYKTVNDSPEAIEFSWEFKTTPVPVTGYKPTATIVIDKSKVDGTKYDSFKEIIYGNATDNARLPMPDEVASHFAAS